MNPIEIALKYYQEIKKDNEVICYKIDNVKHDVEIVCIVPDEPGKVLNNVDDNIFFVTMKSKRYGLISNVESTVLLMFKISDDNEWINVNIDDYQSAEYIAKN